LSRISDTLETFCQPSRHSLCHSQNLLCIPSCTTNFSRCSFSFSAPIIWNELRPPAGCLTHWTPLNVD